MFLEPSMMFRPRRDRRVRSLPPRSPLKFHEWLLLGATSTETDGKFAKITSIQRLATRGGVEPTETCDASSVGKEMRVPYTADYYFYKRK